ncbi:hypothetical protein I603_1557 [Erythrobacter dokdonensis DSW-74]|uniref:Uncharacterized protein n=1 Tax=Erythrobacter dokdonensis DSW-74 TaxID=1300349 RepID=A0A1A7BF86_9SPHN|nr:hypothetical protein I603_1557 [Erythrobacter dokdonensis DSW-74]
MSHFSDLPLARVAETDESAQDKAQKSPDIKEMVPEEYHYRLSK